MNCLQFPVSAQASSFKVKQIASFQYNGKNRVVVIDNVFDNRIIGKNAEGFKAYRFDRMETQPIITVVS